MSTLDTINQAADTIRENGGNAEQAKDDMARATIQRTLDTGNYRETCAEVYRAFERTCPNAVHKTPRSGRNSILLRCGRVMREFTADEQARFMDLGYQDESQSPHARANRKDTRKTEQAAAEQTEKDRYKALMAVLDPDNIDGIWDRIAVLAERAESMAENGDTYNQPQVQSAFTRTATAMRGFKSKAAQAAAKKSA